MGSRDTTIAVIGNCQSRGIASVLELMLPGYTLSNSFSDRPQKKVVDLVPFLRDAGTLLVQSSKMKEVELAAKELGVAPRLLPFPEIYFTGFHPDMISAGGAKHGHESVLSPMGRNHSAICLYGWWSGFTVDQVISLFNADVYDHLGYHNHLEHSRSELMKSAEACGMDLSAAYDEWMTGDCFMHCVNHPKSKVLAELARQMVVKLGLTPAMHYPEQHLLDRLQNIMVWAFYPEIAEAMGKKGEYVFSYSGRIQTPTGEKRYFGIEDFVWSSFQAYQRYSREDVNVIRFRDKRYGALKSFLKSAKAARKAQSDNPYRNLPDHQFWGRAVAAPAMAEVDPVVKAGFKIAPATRVATAGSCFAQHIARTLSKSGFNYYVPEDGAGLDEAERVARNYGVFSARYGNLYTPRQLHQLFDRAYGTFEPVDDVWEDAALGFVDAFRPQVEPAGFKSPEEVRAARQEHLRHVRTMFETLDVFVFTLGLTESWVSLQDGAVYPVAPGVSGGKMDARKYAFVNFTAEETVADLNAFLAKLRGVNPQCKVILTVSPVPLIATYEPRHVLVSTTYSKAALRVAAEAVAKSNPAVDYFPSYEIITGSFNRGAYFGADLRTVTDEGVGHVMRLFLRHYSDARPAVQAPAAAAAARKKPPVDEALAAEFAEGRKIVCDEEAIVADDDE
jgi:hypothetical protein